MREKKVRNNRKSSERETLLFDDRYCYTVRGPCKMEGHSTGILITYGVPKEILTRVLNRRWSNEPSGCDEAR